MTHHPDEETIICSYGEYVITVDDKERATLWIESDVVNPGKRKHYRKGLRVPSEHLNRLAILFAEADNG